LHGRCEQYHALPEAGGLLDQDEGLMARMQALVNAYQAVRGFDHAAVRHELARWADDNPSQYEFVRQLMKAGEL